MRSVQRAVYAFLVAGALLAAVLIGLLLRGGPSPAGDGQPAAGQEVAGYPAAPETTRPPAVLIGLLLRGVPSPTADARSAAGQEAPGYPVPVITPPPSPEGWPTPVPPTPTVTPEPYIQTAEAIMALPTWTPLPTATATLEPTPVPTLGGSWSVALLSGRDERSGYPAILRLMVDAGGEPRGEPDGERTFLDTGFLAMARTAIIGMRPSPDGRRVLVTTAYGEGSAVSVLDVASGQFSHGILYPYGDWWPVAWHPDGERVLATSGFSLETMRVALLDVRTDALEAVAMPWQSGAPPQEGQVWQLDSASFSPGGDQVALVLTDGAGRTNWSEVWVCGLHGDCRLLDARDSHVSHVSWSPRGEWIAVRQETPVQPYDGDYWVGELWLLRPDGSERLQVGATPVGIGDSYAWAPQWSHSGELLAYFGGAKPTQAGQREASIEIWDSATGSTRTLVPQGEGGVHGLIWAPDDQSLWYMAAPAGEESVGQVYRVGVDSGEVTAAAVGLLGDTLGLRQSIRSQVLWLATH